MGVLAGFECSSGWATTVSCCILRGEAVDAMAFDGCYAFWSRARGLFFLLFVPLFCIALYIYFFWASDGGLWEMLLSCLVGWLAFMKF